MNAQLLNMRNMTSSTHAVLRNACKTVAAAKARLSGQSASRHIAMLSAAVLLGLSANVAHADDADHPADKPIQVGSDFGLAPWMMRSANGPEGFGVDLTNEIAKRVGRPGVNINDINFSGIFPALFAKRIEFTVAPIGITAERTEKMLFTEPIVATGNGFLVKAGVKMPQGFGDLKGKAIAVNRGTISDTWATAHAEQYGFTIQRYDVFPDTVQAVLTNRVFAAINEIPTVEFAATKNKAVTVAFEDYDGRNFGFAFRLGDEAYRDKVETAIECMKADGTLVKMWIKWYGSEPKAGSAIYTVYPGYGAPGFKGYEATPHALACKS